MSREILHASCVAWQDRAVLILGKSGSGKSSFALTLMAYGCRLVADDRTDVRADKTDLLASPPASIAGKIEARGLGLLQADFAANVPVICAVDLDTDEESRLPYARHMEISGHSLRLFHNSATMAFPAAILQYLKRPISTQ